MAFWLELHCDTDICDNPPAKCVGLTHEGPMGGVGSHSIAALSSLKTVLLTEATRLGWRRVNDDWLCPACVKARGTKL